MVPGRWILLVEKISYSSCIHTLKSLAAVLSSAFVKHTTTLESLVTSTSNISLCGSNQIFPLVFTGASTGSSYFWLLLALIIMGSSISGAIWTGRLLGPGGNIYRKYALHC